MLYHDWNRVHTTGLSFWAHTLILIAIPVLCSIFFGEGYAVRELQD